MSHSIMRAALFRPRSHRRSEMKLVRMPLERRDDFGVRTMSHHVHTAAHDDAARTRCAARGVAALLASAVVSLLAACSSGPGGTDVTIGSGQDADPVTLDFPVFYVKRPVPDPEQTMNMSDDARELRRFEIGADLYMRDRASPSAPEV